MSPPFLGPLILLKHPEQYENVETLYLLGQTGRFSLTVPTTPRLSVHIVRPFVIYPYSLGSLGMVLTIQSALGRPWR
jgi:hypothetical protein